MTFLYVTHDQEEALTMSDHLAVFNEGRIEQIGSPAEVYERPATEFVAGFVGTSNILERDGRRFTVRPEKVRIDRARRRRGRARPDPRRRLPRRLHALRRRAGRRRRAASHCGRTSRRRRAEALEQRGQRVRLTWLPEHTFEIDHHRTTPLQGGDHRETDPQDPRARSRPRGGAARARRRRFRAATARAC